MFQKKLRQFFIDKGLTYEEIGKQIGYSKTMVGRYLTTNKPNYDFITAVLKVWPEIDMNYLFKSEDYQFLNESDNVYVHPDRVIDEIEERLSVLREYLAQNCHEK